MPCMHCFKPFPRALTPEMLGRASCTSQLHGVTQYSLAYVCMFILEPNCLSDLCYPKEDLELMTLKFFREDPSHGRGTKTRQEGTTGTLFLPHPSWARLELAPILLVEPSAACTSEPATVSPSARDTLLGKAGSRWAKRGTPTPLRQAQFERRGSFLSITDILLEGGRLPVSFSSEERMAKHSNSSQPRFQGNTFKMWSVPLIRNHREFSLRSNPTYHQI